METLTLKGETHLAQGYTVSLAEVRLGVQVSRSSEQSSLHTTSAPHQKREVGGPGSESSLQTANWGPERKASHPRSHSQPEAVFGLEVPLIGVLGELSTLLSCCQPTSLNSCREIPSTK